MLPIFQKRKLDSDELNFQQLVEMEVGSELMPPPFPGCYEPQKTEGKILMILY